MADAVWAMLVALFGHPLTISRLPSAILAVFLQQWNTPSKNRLDSIF